VIAAELESLLQPLETFEAIRRRAMRLGERLCDLSYANPYAGVAPRTRAVLKEALDHERRLDLQYSPFGGHTLARRAVADALAESHALSFTHEDVVLTPGAMAGLHLALRACAAPGDEVIVPVPCWLDYLLYARHVGLVPVPVPLRPPDFQLDVERIEAAIGERTSAVLISHPSNPAGQCYPRDALAGLNEVLARAERRYGRPLTLISDETHRDFVSPGTYASGASAWPTTLIVYSFGKYHFLQGQRLGYVAVSPCHPSRQETAAALVRLTRITGFCTPTALMQAAIPGLLALRHDHAWLEPWRQRITQELADAGYELARPVATLFVYVATPGGRDDFDFIRELSLAGVLALPAPVFHHRGYFRLSLTGSEEMLERSVPILRRFASP
jgi:aspartate aminotransferase